MISNSISELIFFTNYILRNVVPCRMIGNVHDGSGGVRSWAEKNGFKGVFDFSTEQLSNIDLSSLLRPDAVVAHNPFKECATVDQLYPIMDVLNVATQCIIVAIPTKEHHEMRPTVVATVKQWRENLSNFGTTVEIRHCNEHSLFLVLK